MGLPTGTVTFWMTDIEGSTRLLQELGPHYADVLADHHAIIRAAVGAGGGTEVDTEGDAFFCVFQSVRGAVEAAAQAQRGLASHSWPGDRPVQVRMGLHTGTAIERDGDYFGRNVAMAARVAAMADGGEVMVTDEIVDALADSVDFRFDEDDRVELKGLPGDHRLWTVVEAA